MKNESMEIISQLNSLIDDHVAQLRSAMDEMQASCCHVAHTLEKMTKPAPTGDEKLYTAFDVIRLVQEAVSEEICGLGDEGIVVAYEVERGIIGKLVKEDEHETGV